jgi:hypothetical protein
LNSAGNPVRDAAQHAPSRIDRARGRNERRHGLVCPGRTRSEATRARASLGEPRGAGREALSRPSESLAASRMSKRRARRARRRHRGSRPRPSQSRHTTGAPRPFPVCPPTLATLHRPRSSSRYRGSHPGPCVRIVHPRPKPRPELAISPPSKRRPLPSGGSHQRASFVDQHECQSALLLVVHCGSPTGDDTHACARAEAGAIVSRLTPHNRHTSPNQSYGTPLAAERRSRCSAVSVCRWGFPLRDDLGAE